MLHVDHTFFEQFLLFYVFAMMWPNTLLLTIQEVSDTFSLLVSLWYHETRISDSGYQEFYENLETMKERGNMTYESLQQAHEVLAALGQELERQIAPDAETTSLYLEPLLMQTLMATVEFLPQELQPGVYHVIDMARLASKNYGNYARLHADKLVNEQVLSFHEEEAAASKELARLRTLD